MTDDISKVVRELREVAETGYAVEARGMTFAASPTWFTAWADRLESATTPAEVELPAIDRDEAFQRDYIPLGRSGWEIQTKGKGSTYRICDKDGDRLAIPDTPYLHETLTRMAREVHADYTTLARQLAEAKAEIERKDSAFVGLRDESVRLIDTLEQAESQLADATRRLGEVEGLLRRYRDEVPLGHQPHMIAHLVDAALKEPK